MHRCKTITATQTTQTEHCRAKAASPWADKALPDDVGEGSRGPHSGTGMVQVCAAQHSGQSYGSTSSWISKVFYAKWLIKPTSSTGWSYRLLPLPHWGPSWVSTAALQTCFALQKSGQSSHWRNKKPRHNPPQQKPLQVSRKKIFRIISLPGKNMSNDLNNCIVVTE